MCIAKDQTPDSPAGRKERECVCVNTSIKRCAEFVMKHRLTYVLFYPLIAVGFMILKIREKVSYDDLFGRIESGSVIVNVPAFHGSFEMNIRSMLLKAVLIEGGFESGEVDLIKRHVDPQRDVIDVGANVGFYTILFSKIISGTRKVLAIEPTPLASEYLRKNIDRNGCAGSVVVFEGVASSKRGDCLINVVSGMEEFSSIGKIVHPSVALEHAVSITVKGDTIDNLVSDFGLEPGFIKIDVEGAEYSVLNGANDTIRRCRPVVILELNEMLLSSCNARPQMVIDLFTEYGYHCVPTSEGVLALPK